MEALFRQLVDELRAKHDCHTVVLYGSRARGDFGPESDIDVLGIRATGDTIRDARLWNGLFLDAFIQAEASLATIDESMLKLCGARILCQQGAIATDLLARVQALHDQGPPAPEPNEQVLAIWTRKMLGRIKKMDVEGNYRRHWLLYQLLEDYFRLRMLWYRGPKESFAWLKANDQATHDAFVKALEPLATDEDLESLIGLVIRQPVSETESPATASINA